MGYVLSYQLSYVYDTFVCFNLALLIIEMNKYKKFNLIIIFATLACHIN